MTMLILILARVQRGTKWIPCSQQNLCINKKNRTHDKLECLIPACLYFFAYFWSFEDKAPLKHFLNTFVMASYIKFKNTSDY